MSQLGEVILKNLLLLKKRLRRAPPQDKIKYDPADYFRWQVESSKALFAKYPNWDVVGKTVLEIGCGLGGRIAYAASAGARRAVGIDINTSEIETARELCPRICPEATGRIEYIACKEDEPLDIGQFDVVILVDSLEHVVSPYKIVRAAYNYVAPGGRFYFSVFGWYHHSGSHTKLIPFANVFFSDETLLNVIRWNVTRPDYVPTMWDSDPPLERWRGIYDLRDRPGEHLNKITIREMKKLMRNSLFPYSRLTVLGFGEQHPILRLLNPLCRIPLVQEVFHSYVIGEFGK